MSVLAFSDYEVMGLVSDTGEGSCYSHVLWSGLSRNCRGLAAGLYLHCKKRFSFFPSPAGMSRTELSQSRAGIIKLFPARENLVSDIPAGDGKNDNLFYSVGKENSTR